VAEGLERLSLVLKMHQIKKNTREWVPGCPQSWGKMKWRPHLSYAIAWYKLAL